jgi:hypothetical protein
MFALNTLDITTSMLCFSAMSSAACIAKHPKPFFEESVSICNSQTSRITGDHSISNRMRINPIGLLKSHSCGQGVLWGLFSQLCGLLSDNPADH